MKIVDKVAAFGCGVVTTVIALAVYVDLSAQAEAGSVVDACANANGTLRLLDPGDACQPGERKVRLRQPEIEDPKAEPKEEPKLLGLQQRVKALEEKATGGRLLGSRGLCRLQSRGWLRVVQQLHGRNRGPGRNVRHGLVLRSTITLEGSGIHRRG